LIVGYRLILFHPQSTADIDPPVHNNFNDIS